MASILFGLEIVAFVFVAWWAYTNDKAQPNLADKGLLAMRTAAGAAVAVAKRVPTWRKALRGAPQQPDDGELVLPRQTPQWKRQLRPRQRH